MLEAIEDNRQPKENFYEGYIVNAILDAAFLSAKSKKWEAVKIEDWRGVAEQKKEKQIASYDEDHYLIKEETLPSGEKKYIVKNKKTGSIEKR
jgi:hypothetical protein